MTVGQELAQKTGFKLFSNHLLVDALQSVFDSESTAYRMLVREFRRRVFEEAIQAKLPGVIFTCTTAFNRETCVERLFEWINLWKHSGAIVHVVELQATLEERLKRNTTENRLYHKQSTRNLEQSQQTLLKNNAEWVMEAPPGLFDQFPYIKLDTTTVSCEKATDLIVAQLIRQPCEAFELATIKAPHEPYQ